MSAVDEILASGRYPDRRGRYWQRYAPADTWSHFPSSRRLTRAQMRLLIERDQHRDECPGLKRCSSHPVPLVLVDRGYFCTPFGVYRGDNTDYPDIDCDTLPAAMDAARALAVAA